MVYIPSYKNFEFSPCRYSDMGTVVIGKVESGRAQKGDSLIVMPNRVSTVFPLHVTLCKSNSERKIRHNLFFFRDLFLLLRLVLAFSLLLRQFCFQLICYITILHSNIYGLMSLI